MDAICLVAWAKLMICKLLTIKIILCQYDKLSLPSNDS